MPVVDVMQASVDDIVCVIPVGHRFMAATRSVDVIAAALHGVATIRIYAADFNDMPVTVIFMRVMEVPIDEIVCMVSVAYGRVATAGTVLMFGVRVGL